MELISSLLDDIQEGQSPGPWLREPVTDRELAEAHLANAILDAHRDDPEFGYRFLADEVREAGHFSV